MALRRLRPPAPAQVRFESAGLTGALDCMQGEVAVPPLEKVINAACSGPKL